MISQVGNVFLSIDKTCKTKSYIENFTKYSDLRKLVQHSIVYEQQQHLMTNIGRGNK